MKVCFVGIGSIAKRHISNLQTLCSEQGIDVSIDALRRTASNAFDLPEAVDNVYTSVDSLPIDYDVIFLTNPTEYHADMLIALHNHSKHFFIEKPVTSLETLNKLEGFKFRENSVYYVACPLRYTNVISYVKENVDPKEVNAVRSISSSYLPDWRPGTDYRNTYSAHKDMGGGVDIDLIHEWDYLTYMFGMPSQVKCFSGKVSKLEIDSSDYAIYIAKFGEDMICELHLDYFGRETIRTIEIYTDEDTIVGDLVNGNIKYLKSGQIIELSAERDEYQTEELQYFLQLLDVNDSIAIKPYNDVRNACKILRLTQGIVSV